MQLWQLHAGQEQTVPFENPWAHSSRVWDPLKWTSRNIFWNVYAPLHYFTEFDKAHNNTFGSRSFQKVVSPVWAGWNLCCQISFVSPEIMLHTMIIFVANKVIAEHFWCSTLCFSTIFVYIVSLVLRSLVNKTSTKMSQYRPRFKKSAQTPQK